MLCGAFDNVCSRNSQDDVYYDVLDAHLIKIVVWYNCACSTLPMSLLNTLRELAHNPLGAGSQPLGSRLIEGVGLAGLRGGVCWLERMG